MVTVWTDRGRLKPFSEHILNTIFILLLMCFHFSCLTTEWEVEIPATLAGFSSPRTLEVDGVAPETPTHHRFSKYIPFQNIFLLQKFLSHNPFTPYWHFNFRNVLQFRHKMERVSVSLSLDSLNNHSSGLVHTCVLLWNHGGAVSSVNSWDLQDILISSVFVPPEIHTV